MVAFQQAHYDSKGEICAPLEQLMVIGRELNGEFTQDPDHWHRHTIAATSKSDFERRLGELKKALAQSGAEVFRLDPSSATVLDVYYLIEDRKRSAQIKADLARGKCPEERSANELIPYC